MNYVKSMRPNNQQKQRSRGRNGGRKHVNPMSRNFESNGPDVKIRGNAAHIAEKYVQLARDAQASGDSVMEQNYLQHAEHYFRIVSASQPAGTPRYEPNNYDNDTDDEMDGEENASEPNGAAEPAEPVAAGPANGNGSNGSDEQAEPEASADSEQERRPRRDRNRARRPRTEGISGDPGSAPQPELGELPAFIRAPGQSDATD